MYNPLECHLCISECAIIRDREDSRGLAVRILQIESSLESWFNDTLLSLPAYEYNDRRDHRGEEHKTAEYSQGDHGSQVQLGLMGAIGMLRAVHSEGTRRFWHARTDTRLCVVHAASGYLVVLRMIAAGVVGRWRCGSVQADTRPLRDRLPHRRWQFRGVRYISRRHGNRAGGGRWTRRGSDPRSKVRPNFWSGRTCRRSGRRTHYSWFLCEEEFIY